MSLLERIMNMDCEPDPLSDLLAACRDLRDARDERTARTRAWQEAAAHARRTGERRPPPESPRVWDLTEVTDRICEALDRLEDA